jgi:hypothetical protein
MDLFLIFSKTWRQEDMEVKTFYIPFGSVIEVKLAVGE